MELARWAISLAIPAAAGVVGVIVGAFLTSRREKRQRQLAFLEKQLSLFYSPMLGIRNEIQAQGLLRVRIQNEASAAWKQLCAEIENMGFDRQQKISSERGPEFSKIIEYDNEKLHSTLLPAYKKMIALFRENYWLAEPSTRNYYPEAIEFVEIWARWVDKALPIEVLNRLEHKEEKLISFYKHLEEKHDEIRKKLKSGDSDA